MLEHKSESKYVQRKKAGQRQINRDKQGKGVMNSGNLTPYNYIYVILVGSQMRKENEKLLQMHI